MEMEFSGNPKPFGVIGLVLAIISLLFSLIPCVGFYAVIPGILATIFSLIAYLYLKQKKESTSVPFAGLIIGLLAISISIYQYIEYQEVFETKSEIENSIKEGLEEQVIQEVLDNLEEGMEPDTIEYFDTIEYIENDTLQ
jgi:multisubunit Na+/H+ antiporter MnhB subunit